MKPRVLWWSIGLVALAVLIGGGFLAFAPGPAPTPQPTPLAQDIQRISPQAAKALLDAGAAVLYDARSHDAYVNEHAQAALSLPATTVPAHSASLPTDKDLIFYCT